MGGDGSESGWGWVGMETKSAGTGGDGCDFCPSAGLYCILVYETKPHPDDPIYYDRISYTVVLYSFSSIDAGSQTGKHSSRTRLSGDV